jgi:transcriptional regulator of arginine metabolism
MSKLILDSGPSRRSLIIELVENGVIHSQSDLVKALAKKGIKVTQATASRDLEELGAVRGKDASGVFRYQFIANTEVATSSLKNLVLEIDASGNLAVIKTPPGAAQLLAGQLDRAIKNGAISGIGSIAGDDTIMVIAKSANGGSALAKAIDRYVSDNQSMKRVR